ncbi:MAG: peptidyl-prolyl cis-trans isomerase [Myxococcota bacterium]
MWRPLLQFALLGTALFTFDRLWWDPPRAEPVVIAEARVRAVHDELARALRRAPERAELERALAPEVDETLLYREALARGYDRGDPVIFRRLVQNLRFAGADESRDDAALYAEAIEMGMHRTDIVVRRRLVQRMRLDLEAAGVTEEPAEDALRSYLETHADRYRSPARVRLRQLYFRGEADARAALAELRGATNSEDGRPRGDAFLHPAEQPSQTERELGDRFGASFASEVFASEAETWSGPVASAYGTHLVWVHERTPERAQRFEEVRDQVRYAWLAERRREALETALERLREGVPVEVQWPAS